MDHSTRMLRTLGTLVVSMTGTATLLGWIDPASPPAGDAIPTETVLAQARSAVSAPARGVPASWSGIELKSAPARVHGERALTASAGARDAHFTIDLAGRCFSSDIWRNQAFVGNGSTEIRIRVMQQAVGEPMSKPQWTAVRALVSQLDVLLATEPALPVYLEPDLAAAYGLAPDVSIHVPTLQ